MVGAGLANLQGRTLQVVTLIGCSLDFLLFGWDQGVISGLIGTEQLLDTLGHPGPGLLGTIVSCFPIGCLVGSILTFFIGNRLGRLKTILVGLAFIIVGAIIQTAAMDAGMMSAGRVLTGIGNGISASTVPIYQSEVTRNKHRGPFIMIEVAFIIFGMCFSGWVDFFFVFLSGIESSAVWRIPIGMQLMFPIGGLICWPFMIESPRWLAGQGRYDEVYANYIKLHSGHLTEKEARDEASIVIRTAEHERAIAGRWTDMFKNGEIQNLRRILLGAGTQLFQQFTGINVLGSYAPVLLRDSIGLSPRMAQIVSACGSTAFFIGSLLPIWMIDRLGRRKTMLMGLFACSLGYYAIGAATGVGQSYPQHQTAAGWAVVSFLMVYYFFYGWAWAGTPWLVAAEMNSLVMRDRGTAISTAVNWLSNYIVVLVTPVGIENLKYKFYFVWATFTAVFFVICHLCYPETGGRSLEDMDAYFAKHRQVIVFRHAYDNPAQAENIGEATPSGASDIDVKFAADKKVESTVPSV